MGKITKDSTYLDVESIAEPPLKMTGDLVSTPTRPTQKCVRAHSKGVVKRCRCGSITHRRTNHRYCPYNKANKKKAGGVGSKLPIPSTSRNSTRGSKHADGQSCDKAGVAGGKLPIASASGNRECQSSDDESMYSEDEGGIDLDVDVFVLSSDEDSDIRWFTQLCTCDGRAHARECPLNPRNRGAPSHALPSKTTEPTPSSEAEPSGSSRGLSSDRPDASDGLVSEGEGITDCEGPIQYVISGTPTSSWKDDAITFLGSLTDTPVVRMVESIRPIECQEIAPHTRDSIMPDGNCMYRAISKHDTGSQDNHMALRLAMIKFMLNREHAPAIANWLQAKYNAGGSDIEEIQKGAVAAVRKYVESKHIASNSRWGTANELIVMATMFQISIFVFSRVTGGVRGWGRVKPLFSNPFCMPECGFSIFLYHNRSEDHYDCVIPSE